jgi:predicted TIM-barrel enzyme
MAGFTNRGKYAIMESYFRADTQYTPGGFKVALVTSATAPAADHNVLSDLTQIATGNGYTDGGATIARNSTDVDTCTEDDGNDRSYIRLKDVVWTASGGPIPASGNGARYAVLLDDDTTPNLIGYWDLSSDRQVSDGQSLTLQDCELRFNES